MLKSRIEKALKEDKDNYKKFDSLLDDKADPFTNFEPQTEFLANDPRYYSLSTFKDRRTRFYSWARTCSHSSADEAKFVKFVKAKKKPNQSFNEFKRKYKTRNEYVSCKIPESVRLIIFREN